MLLRLRLRPLSLLLLFFFSISLSFSIFHSLFCAQFSRFIYYTTTHTAKGVNVNLVHRTASITCYYSTKSILDCINKHMACARVRVPMCVSSKCERVRVSENCVCMVDVGFKLIEMVNDSLNFCVLRFVFYRFMTKCERARIIGVTDKSKIIHPFVLLCLHINVHVILINFVSVLFFSFAFRYSYIVAFFVMLKNEMSLHCSKM